MTTPLDLAIDALAVARLARLATVDEIPVVKRPRDAIMRRYPPHGACLSPADGWQINQGDTATDGWARRPDGRRITGQRLSVGGHEVLQVDERSGSSLGYLVQCPWCTSAYIAAGALLARRLVPRSWSVAAYGLALSYAAGHLNSTA